MLMAHASSKNAQDLQDLRRAAMAVLCQSETASINAFLSKMVLPDFDELRRPENGLVMLRGRVGGDGAPFNVGEATVSRAAVRLKSGETGFGYVLGRDRDKARLVALCDALIQCEAHRAQIERHVIAPLHESIMKTREERAAQAAATRVDFYTLVRGEG